MILKVEIVSKSILKETPAFVRKAGVFWFQNIFTLELKRIKMHIDILIQMRYNETIESGAIRWKEPCGDIAG